MQKNGCLVSASTSRRDAHIRPVDLQQLAPMRPKAGASIGSMNHAPRRPFTTKPRMLASLRSSIFYIFIALGVLTVALCGLTSRATAASLLWSRQLGTTAVDISRGVSTDGAGGFYVSGYTEGSLASPVLGVQDGFLAKYDLSGDLKWAAQVGTSKFFSGPAADHLGNVYVGGTFDGPNAPAPFLRKYDFAGNVQWSKPLGSDYSEDSLTPAADSLGNVFVAGNTFGNVGGPNAGSEDVWISKYNSQGARQWTTQFGAVNGDYCTAIAVDGQGSLYVTGITEGNLGGPSAGAYDAFVAKFDAAGNRLWTKQIGTSAYDYSLGVSADLLGNVFISGHTGGALGGPNAGEVDAFVAKFDGAGNLQWNRQLGSSGADECSNVSADGLGNVYIAGSTQGNLGGSNAGGFDAFLAKYNSTGTLLWTQQFGTSASDAGGGVAADGSGAVCVAENTSVAFNFGPVGLGGDVILAKYVENAPEPLRSCWRAQRF